MTKIKSLAQIFAFLMTLNFAAVAAAQCGVPVCDIPAALQQLETANQTTRAQTMKDLRIQYRAETNPVIFSNLKEFAQAGKALFVRLKEEDWVIREATYLENVSLVGLLKFAPINRADLISNFDQLSDEASVFEVLNYWVQQVDKIEINQQVLDLVSFAEHAKEWAIRTKQEAYIAREADKIITAGGQQVSRLNPFHEGVYKIAATCSPTPKDCDTMVKTLSHISILETLGARGLVVSFSNGESSMAYYVFTTAELTKNGSHVRGISTEATPWTRVSEANLDIDPVSGVITGTLKDMRFTGVMNFKATPVRRITEYYSDPQGPSRTTDIDSLLGHYRGTFNNMKDVDLVISRYSSDVVVGVLSQGAFILSFRMGSYNVAHGVLTLTASGSGNTGDRKLTLALRKDKNGREILTGFLFSDVAKVPTGTFSWVSAK